MEINSKEQTFRRNIARKLREDFDFNNSNKVTAKEYFGEDNEFGVSCWSKYALDEQELNFPAYAFLRWASEIASMEEVNHEQFCNDLFKDFYLGIWRPGGSIMSGIGHPSNISLQNCTTIPLLGDTLEAIYETKYKMAKALAYRQGLGVDISKLRPRNTRINNASKKSLGAIHWMAYYNSIGRYIGQEGRVPALLFSISIKHPDVEEFIICKSDLKVIENANISVQIEDAFMRAVESNSIWCLEFEIPEHNEKIRYEKSAVELFEKLCENAVKYAEPGVQFMDIARRESTTDWLGYPIISSNACFKAGTLIKTKNGHYPIETLIDKTIEIWDGSTWVLVDNFRVTGENKDIYNVELYDGSSIYVTDYHKLILESGQEVETRNLVIGSKLKLDNSKVIEGIIEEKGCYFKGFMIGDGTTANLGKNPALMLYPPKYFLEDKLISSVLELDREETYNNREHTELGFSIEYKSNKKFMSGLNTYKNQLLPFCLDYKNRLPVQIYNWTTKSKCEFISGLFDADGTCIDTKKGIGYQFGSISKNLLLDLQRLLKTIGIKSKIGVLREEGETDFNDGYGAYKTKKCFRLVINQRNSIELSKICKFNRLKSFEDRLIKNSFSEKFNQVVAITNCGNEEKVYCCTVKTTGRLAITDGLIVGNCSEKLMCGDSGCMLASWNILSLLYYFEFGVINDSVKDYISKLAKRMIRALDDCVSWELLYDKSPYPEQKAVVTALREIGIGYTNLSGWLLESKLGYDTNEGIDTIEEIVKTFSTECWKASIELGKEKGNCPAFQSIYDKYGEKETIERSHSSGFLKRLHEKHNIAVTHMRNGQLMAIAPTGTLSQTFPKEVNSADSAGTEPLTGLYYWKRTRLSGQYVWYFCIINQVRKELNRRGFENVPKAIEDNDGTIGKHWGSIIDSIFDPKEFKPAHHINPFKKVEMMGRIAKYIDSSISITYNLPVTATVETVKEIYMSAWKHGVKSVSVYRDQSREGIIEFVPPDEVSKRFSKKEVIQTQIDKSKPTTIKISSSAVRPESLPCRIEIATVEKIKYIFFVGLLDKKPYEVFGAQLSELKLDDKLPYSIGEGIIRKIKSSQYELIKTGNNSIIIHNIGEAINNPDYADITRLVSLSLRHGVPVDAIGEQLEKVDKPVSSFAKALRRVLLKFNDAQYNGGAKCKICESTNTIRKEGCVTCLDCGGSACG